MTARNNARAITFPGQGSQQVGMGAALAAWHPAARAVLDEVDDALGEIWRAQEALVGRDLAGGAEARGR